MFVSKFVYDLTGRVEPSKDELDKDIDRLLFLESIESPDYLLKPDERDLIHLDSEVLRNWIKRRFEPALLLLLLEHEANQYLSKSELTKMDTYDTLVDKYFRYDFVKRRASQRVKDICFDNPNQLDISNAVTKLKRTLTLLSVHLEENGTNFTLFGTDMYTQADVTLYNYLKRIVVGKYKDLGLKSHVKLCEPIKEFMHRYATKNPRIIDVSSEDPLDNEQEPKSLLADMTKPAIVALLFIGFYIWRRDHMML